MSATRRRLTRDRRLTVVNGILVLVILIVILQLWLLTATMNVYLGGESGFVIPAALASLACFGLNAGLLRYLYRLDSSSPGAPSVSRNALSVSASTECCRPWSSNKKLPTDNFTTLSGRPTRICPDRT